jgi:glucosamine--fructose-6-phosphate aminotransferase (isomerizing)
MKHGPIALIDPKTPTVFLVPQDAMYEKTMANLAMIRARKGPIIALATEGDTGIKKVADDVIYLPKTLDLLNPILATCRCNCSPITSPWPAAATWTNPATSPKA